jgi:hypothetical protein
VDGHGHAGGEHHEDSAALAKSPTEVALTNVLNDQGTEAALAKLEELAAADTGTLQQAHSYVHMIGRLSFERYGSAKAAFPHCQQQKVKFTFKSGSDLVHPLLRAQLAESSSRRSEVPLARLELYPENSTLVTDTAINQPLSMNC